MKAPEVIGTLVINQLQKWLDELCSVKPLPYSAFKKDSNRKCIDRKCIEDNPKSSQLGEFGGEDVYSILIYRPRSFDNWKNILVFFATKINALISDKKRIICQEQITRTLVEINTIELHTLEKRISALERHNRELKTQSAKK